jgi:hypothetical protein
MNVTIRSIMASKMFSPTKKTNKVKMRNNKVNEYKINPISKTEKVKEYRDAFRKSK